MLFTTVLNTYQILIGSYKCHPSMYLQDRNRLTSARLVARHAPTTIRRPSTLTLPDVSSISTLKNELTLAVCFLFSQLLQLHLPLGQAHRVPVAAVGPQRLTSAVNDVKNR